MKIHQARFITSAPSIEHAPPDGALPEVAVVGRSNVGKSSFLSSLVGHSGLAKVSATPGKTRLINYFLVDDSWYLVDLPGYGYAKVSKAEQERWARSLEVYLERREGLVRTILLVDVRHGPRDSDLQMYGWLASRREAPLVVLTKADKLSRTQAVKAHRDSAATLGLPLEEVLLYSSVTRHGRDEVLAVLGNLLRGPA